MAIQVVSMCSLAHEDVWIKTSSLLPEMVPADLYTVYVPRNEMAKFRSITHPGIKVCAQEQLATSFGADLRDAIDTAGNAERFGWYAQQYMKIEALLQSQSRDVVIWDADCVPVRPIQLFDTSNRPMFMFADEYHAEYFVVIEKLLGRSRALQRSFVIPGFPIPSSWAHAMIEEIERRHGKPWHQAAIECTDFSSRSGFSETETLGTWVATEHPGEWKSVTYKWERFGTSRFGAIDGVSLSDLEMIARKYDLDIISFENWDKRGLRSFLRSVKRRLKG